ncbi:MAG: hypothetical protein ACI4KE_03935 [Anaerovoracaceae bacterium]
MKKLGERKEVRPAKGGRGVLTTESIYSKEEAVEAKIRQIEPKLLGIKMIRYNQKSIRRVWVPCYFMVYDFNLNNNVLFNNRRAFDRSGTCGVVFDANEMHASHYDVLTDGDIPFVKRDISLEGGIVLPDNGSMDEIIAKAEFSIRRQILFKAYKTDKGELKRKKTVKFYREAYEMEMTYRDRTFKKYAYLDDYGVHNERARGLNTRLNPNI